MRPQTAPLPTVVRATPEAGSRPAGGEVGPRAVPAGDVASAVPAAFWCRALGYVDAVPPAGSATWEEWLASVGVPHEEWGDGAYIEDPEGLRPGISPDRFVMG